MANPWYGKSMMRKSELIEALREEARIRKNKAEQVVELFFAEISKALARGERVEIRGFCSFFVKNYESYMGINPKTKEPVQVAAKKMPFFRCGTELKKRVDYPQADESPERDSRPLES
jgi:integration host factor subunit beta